MQIIRPTKQPGIDIRQAMPNGGMSGSGGRDRMSTIGVTTDKYERRV
jgi:hypothetical protein